MPYWFNYETRKASWLRPPDVFEQVIVDPKDDQNLNAAIIRQCRKKCSSVEDFRNRLTFCIEGRNIFPREGPRVTADPVDEATAQGLEERKAKEKVLASIDPIDPIKTTTATATGLFRNMSI